MYTKLIDPRHRDQTLLLCALITTSLSLFATFIVGGNPTFQYAPRVYTLIVSALTGIIFLLNRDLLRNLVNDLFFLILIYSLFIIFSISLLFSFWARLILRDQKGGLDTFARPYGISEHNSTCTKQNIPQ